MLNRTFVSGSTLGAGLALLVAAGTADAAVVTFSSADFTADTQISTDGTAVGAVNGGTVAAGTTLVNTVVFENVDATEAGAGVVALTGGLGATLNIHSNTVGQGAGVGAAGALTSDTLFGAGGGGDVGGPIGDLVFAGLTDGQDYQVQFVFSDTRALGGSTIAITTDGPGLAPLAIDGPAQIVTGTFTADATGTQTFNIVQATGCCGSFPGAFNAVQLREVPEPGSLALLGLGGLMIARRRRA